MLSPADAIANAAESWADPDHPTRQRAVQASLEVSDTLTEPALTFCLNQFADALRPEALAPAINGAAPSSSTLGIVDLGPVPLDALRVAARAWAAGHGVHASVPAATAELLGAFASDIEAETALARAKEESVLEGADALIAMPQAADEARALRSRTSDHGLTSERCLVLPPAISVAILDGEESEEEREDLAEDVLLYEGSGPRSVKVIWAPREHPPDDYLDAFAQFRGVVPAHASTPGALQMPRAMLEAQGASHAFSDDLSFLVSRDAPEPQPGAHVRWSEYDALGAATDWVAEHAAHLYAVVARSALHSRLDLDVPVVAPGRVHRPSLGDSRGQAVQAFLQRLAA